MESAVSCNVKSARTCRKCINSHIRKITSLLEQLQSVKAVLDRSVRTPMIIALYNQYKGKTCVQSVQVVKSLGESKACFESPTDKSSNNSISKQEMKMINDSGFIDFVKKSTEYKENQNDVKNFVTAIHKYKKELSLMARQYSSLLEHVNYLSSICQKS